MSTNAMADTTLHSQNSAPLSSRTPRGNAFFRKSTALFLRGLRSAFTDKGRVADLIIFPLTFLVIWGLFVSAEIMPADQAIPLLLVNLVWSVSSSYQMQANFLMMYDIWSGELTEILRSGVSHHHYLMAKVLLATVIGTFNLMIFFLALLFVFDVDLSHAVQLFITWPAYFTASIALSLPVAGAVIRLGRSYAFMTWTMLQIVIMFSSPFTPMSTLPTWMRWVAGLSPFSYIFEYIRFGGADLLWIATILSLVYAGLGLLTYNYLFDEARKNGRLTGLT